MPAARVYKAYCPNNCGAGERIYQVKGDLAPLQIAPEVLTRREDRDTTWRCMHCGFVWFQKSSSRGGYDPTPAGFFDSFGHPDEFVPVPISFRVREEATPAFWQKLREKRAARRGKRR